MRKNTTKMRVLGLLLVVIMAMFALVGCGGEPTLEDYMNDNPDVMEILQDSVAGSPMTVDVKENTIYYVYTYDETYDSASIEIMASYFESAEGDMQTEYENLVSVMEKESGVEGIGLELRYEDAEHTEIYTYNFQ